MDMDGMDAGRRFAPLAGGDLPQPEEDAARAPAAQIARSKTAFI